MSVTQATILSALIDLQTYVKENEDDVKALLEAVDEKNYPHHESKFEELTVAYQELDKNLGQIAEYLESYRDRMSKRHDEWSEAFDADEEPDDTCDDVGN